MELVIPVSYKSTNSAIEASFWLRKLPPLIALDFETAPKWSDEDKAIIEASIPTLSTFEERRQALQRIASTGLSHPSLTQLTHMSLATSDRDAMVFIIDNIQLERFLMNWLVTTPIKQIWHNASFDFKLIYYRTGKFPLSYEDSQQYAKTIINHTDIFKARTGLKELMGHRYGPWGITEDHFNISQIYEPKVLLYAATDACATYALYTGMEASHGQTASTSL